MIEFNNAHIGYNETIISIESLILKKSNVYILAGRNGAGKSTLLKTITKQEKLLNGDILFNGISISNIRENNVAKHLAFVQSTFPKIDFMKVKDFVSLGRAPHTNALGRLHQLDIEKTKKAIKALEIDHLSEKFTSELSDGERQMVAIAKAIAQETDIVLLDEPTAFLDYANKIKVLNLLKKIASEMNKCIILSSHDIDLSIESHCTFIVISRNEKKIHLLKAPINKTEVLKIAFS